jgi:hypothetical protein
MNEKLVIYLWHGTLNPEQIEKLKVMDIRLNTDKNTNSNYGTLEMTLDDFAKNWKEKFMVYPLSTESGWWIGVTEFNGFGAR